MENAFLIAKDVRPFLDQIDEEFIVVVEYPIMATMTGAYLSMITTKLDSLFRSYKVEHVYYLPSIAVKSYTKTNSKSEIIKWVKATGLAVGKSYNHDEATALVLAEIGLKCHQGKYKNSFFHVNYRATIGPTTK